MTKPQPFKLHKGRTEERTRKTLIDMAVDNVDLPEMRWPYTRGGRCATCLLRDAGAGRLEGL